MFRQLNILLEEKGAVEEKMPYKCEICDISFTRKAYLTRHTKKKHTKEEKKSDKKYLIQCPFCSSSKKVERDNFYDHLKESHKNISSEFEKTSCISNNVCLFRKYLHSEEKTIQAFTRSNSTVESIFNLIKTQLVERIVFRASIALTANYEIPDWQDDGGEKSADSDSFTLRSKGQIFNRLQSNRQIKNRIRKMLKGAADRNEDLLHRGSGWKFVNLSACDVLLYQVKLM